MFKFYFNKPVLTGFLLVLIILSWLGIASYRNTKKSIDSSRMVAHTLNVLYATERVLTVSSTLELGERGYFLTGNEEFLNVFEQSKDSIESYVENLKALTLDNAQQQQRILALEKSIADLVFFSSARMESRADGSGVSGPRHYSLEGKRLMDNIRASVSAIRREENTLLMAGNAAGDNHALKAGYMFIALLIISVFMLLVVFWAVNRNLKRRMKTGKKLNEALDEIKDLYEHAPCGYHSLDPEGRFVNVNNTLTHWLGYTKEEMLGKKFTDILSKDDLPVFYERFDNFKQSGSAYNVAYNFSRKDGSEFPVVLEAVAVVDQQGKFVKSRSVTIDNTERKLAEDKIKALNHELEAFSYSVSHDLRAPLRSIDGYARILYEDYAEKLDDQGKRVIDVVISNARRMGKLIDDLLDFSRLGRKDLLRSHLDMTQLAGAVIQALVWQNPEHKIDVKLNTLAPAYGDVNMIRQVWQNLLSNALKYTSKTHNACVAISSEEFENEICYKIEDNGVGFDMQYAPKLFGVFQRLHKIEDFEGTGVGLAIVKRIIDRHEGRVWAEAKLNEGATFYFTIPNNNGTR